MDKYKFALLIAFVAFVFTFFACSSDDGNDDGEGNSNSYGTLEYGGQTYKTVVIGEQTWMAENLNYKTETGSYCLYEGEEEIDYYDEASSSFVVGTLTPQQIADNCAKFGRLYEYETAKTVCPSGWHLPSNAEWNELINYAGDSLTAGTKLKATKGWHRFEFDDEGKVKKVIEEGGNGTDDFGFSALPGGCHYTDKDDDWNGCLEADFGGLWWSMDELSEEDYKADADYDEEVKYVPAAYYQIINFDGRTLLTYNGKGFGFSVRCVKD